MVRLHSPNSLSPESRTVASRLQGESCVLLCICCTLNHACAFVWDSAKLLWAKTVTERMLTAQLEPCSIYYYKCDQRGQTSVRASTGEMELCAGKEEGRGKV